MCLNNVVHHLLKVPDPNVSVAKSCGYEISVSVDNDKMLKAELLDAKNNESISFIEIKCAIGARSDLGRPGALPMENKELFM